MGESIERQISAPRWRQAVQFLLCSSDSALRPHTACSAGMGAPATRWIASFALLCAAVGAAGRLELNTVAVVHG